MIRNNGELTGREYEQMKHEREMLELQTAHVQRLAEIEHKFASWLKIPLVLLKLPVSALICVVLLVYAIRGMQPPESLLKLL
jgi:hypothetical protein